MMWRIAVFLGVFTLAGIALVTDRGRWKTVLLTTVFCVSFLAGGVLQTNIWPFTDMSRYPHPIPLENATYHTIQLETEDGYSTGMETRLLPLYDGSAWSLAGTMASTLSEQQRHDMSCFLLERANNGKESVSGLGFQLYRDRWDSSVYNRTFTTVALYEVNPTQKSVSDEVGRYTC